MLLNVAGGAGDGYTSLNGDDNSSVKLDIWGSQRIRGDLTLSASNDGKPQVRSLLREYYICGYSLRIVFTTDLNECG